MKGRIDPHVHFRDGKQAYKETIAHGLQLASEQGVEKVFDMPNTDPPILYEKDVLKRLDLVPDEEAGRYFLYMGATANEEQLEEVVKCYEKYPQVIGIKMFAGRSVGDLAIIEEEGQRKVYRTLKELGYEGVLAVHCERENHILPLLWDPLKPHTHGLARPVSAETNSIIDQMKFVKEEKFEGTLHVCHVSCPESVELIDDGRELNMKITCGVTPHHLIWSEERMKRGDGLLYKMNPPLRSKGAVKELRKCFTMGRIDWIETDHAPHPVGEKLYPPYMSGYPSLYLYRNLLEVVKGWGIKDEQLDALTRGNIVKTFGRKVA